jgi:hypothetical protein
MSKFASVSQQVRLTFVGEKLTEFERALENLPSGSICADKLDLVSKMFTSLPSLKTVSQDNNIWFKSMRIAFHPDKNNNSPKQHRLAEYIFKLVIHCADTRKNWFVKWKSKSNKKNTNGSAYGETFNKSRMDFFKDLVAKEQKNERKRKSMEKKEKKAFVAQRAKQKNTIFSWINNVKERKADIKKEFKLDRESGALIAIKRVKKGRIVRGGGRRRHEVVLYSNKKRLNELVMRQSDYSRYVDFLLFYLPRKYVGIRSLLSREKSKVAELIEEFELEMPPITKNVISDSIMLANEIVLRDGGRKKSSYVQDESYEFNETNKRKKPSSGLQSTKKKRKRIKGG